MAITAKELAQLLNLSEAAVSMALNNKAGVSTQTRQRVWSKALEMGYDFSRIHARESRFKGVFCFVTYLKVGSVISESPQYNSLFEGAFAACRRSGYDLTQVQLFEDQDLPDHLYQLRKADYTGLILLATEMDNASLAYFADFKLPIMLIDASFDNPPYDCVLVNNAQGTELAVTHLISRTRKLPGYLHSSYVTSVFAARSKGFFDALRRHGLSTASSVVHLLPPSRQGAYNDMKTHITDGEELAECYFADTDEIALGAIQAFQEAGYRVPEDICVVGFGDIPQAESASPALTTIHVPQHYIGDIAASRLIQILDDRQHCPTRIEVSTRLVKRKSI